MDYFLAWTFTLSQRTVATPVAWYLQMRSAVRYNRWFMPGTFIHTDLDKFHAAASTSTSELWRPWNRVLERKIVMWHRREVYGLNFCRAPLSDLFFVHARSTESFELRTIRPSPRSFPICSQSNEVCASFIAVKARVGRWIPCGWTPGPINLAWS